MLFVVCSRYFVYVVSYFVVFYCSDDEDENPPITATAKTSTSHTLVVAEAQPDEEETSPPQQDVELTAPIESPRASTPKRARVEPAKETSQLIGSSTTPSLDDVSPSLLFCVSKISILLTPLYFCFFCLLLSNFSISILIFLPRLFFCSL